MYPAVVIIDWDGLIHYWIRSGDFEDDPQYDYELIADVLDELLSTD